MTSSYTHVTSTKAARWQTVSPVADGQAPQKTISLDGAAARQTIDGFGGCFNELGHIALCTAGSETQQRVMTELFADEGCAFSLCRMPVGSNDFSTSYYSFNDVRDDYQMEHFSIERDRKELIPYIRKAQAIRPGLELWASPWCPPQWMKQSGVYQCAAANANWGQEEGHDCDDLRDASYIREEKQVLKAYALYFVKFVQAYANEAIRIGAIHPQNEVFAAQIFPSCLWKKEVMVEFMVNHLQPAFAAHGLDTEIWFGTMNGGDYEYVDYILSNPEVRRVASGIGLQWFGKEIVEKINTQHPHYRIMQTESECRGGRNDWRDAMYIFGQMRHYFNNGASSYMYWNLILDEFGLSNWGWRQNSLVSVDKHTGEAVYNPELYIMKHFSHFVRPGASRIESGDPEVLLFRNADGKEVAVLANESAATQVVEFVRDGHALAVSVPPESVNTVVFP
jgi:glucosylceramidase